MDLFKREKVNLDLNYEITFSCCIKDILYVGSKDGIIYKYQLIKEDEKTSDDIKNDYIKNEKFNIDNNVEGSLRIKLLGNYLIKKNRTINNITIVEEKENLIMLILIDDILYCIKNDKFDILNIIYKNVLLYRINENNSNELLIYTKKKRLYFYNYENGIYKYLKEITNPFNDLISCMLWINNSLFLTINKEYYFLNIKNNEKVLLYSHEYEQTYKNITLIDMHEIFIVCDLNIGVFYDVDTSMPSRKNTIILSGCVKQIISFRFFLCCLNFKGVINIYNIKNQQHIQEISLNYIPDIVINFTNIKKYSGLMSLFNNNNDDDDEDKVENILLYNQKNKIKWTSSDRGIKFYEEKKNKGLLKMETEGILSKSLVNDFISGLSKNDTYDHNNNMLYNKYLYENNDIYTNNINIYNNTLYNNLYFINKDCLQILSCLEIYEYLPQCIEQGKTKKGFILIENYAFQNKKDKYDIICEYNKACAYHFFKNLNFSVSFIFFQKININIFFLLFFWIDYLPSSHKNIMQKMMEYKVIQENINKQFKSFLPFPCSIKELIDRNYNNYIKGKPDYYMSDYMFNDFYHNNNSNCNSNDDDGEKNNNTYINSSTYENNTSSFINSSEKRDNEIKKKLLHTANKCLVNYLLLKRDYLLQNKDMYKLSYKKKNHNSKNFNDNSKDLKDNSKDLNDNEYIIEQCIDNLLIKLLTINNYNKQFFHFIMETNKLHIDLEECIQFLKKEGKFVEIIFIYIRLGYFEEAIEICSYFFHYYNEKYNVIKSTGELNVYQYDVCYEGSNKNKNKSDNNNNSGDDKNFACDDKNFACDDKNFACDDKNIACDDKIFSCDDKIFSCDDKNFSCDDKISGCDNKDDDKYIYNDIPQKKEEENNIFTFFNLKELNEEKYFNWIKIFEKENVEKNNVSDKDNNHFQYALQKIYNILIILNDNIHLLNLQQEKIKKLFEYAFPFLIKYNEHFFFHFLKKKNILISPEEIITTFKKMIQIDKENYKIKYYLQKYIIHYLKHDKYNKNINTILIELYINNAYTKNNIKQLQIKLIKFMQYEYPIHIDYITNLIKNTSFYFLKVLLYGKLHRHYESLNILAEQNFRACEKYCLYYNFMLKKEVSKIKEEKYQELYIGIYNNDKDIYYNIFKKFIERKINSTEKKNHYNKRKKKTKKKNFIKYMMNEYHKYIYYSMNKNIPSNLLFHNKNEILNKTYEYEMDEKNKIKKKKKIDQENKNLLVHNEYYYMLHLIKDHQEDEEADNDSDHNDDDILNCYEGCSNESDDITSVGNTSGDKTSGDDTSGNDTSGDDTSGDKTSDDNTNDDDTSDNDTNDDDTSGDNTNDNKNIHRYNNKNIEKKKKKSIKISAQEKLLKGKHRNKDPDALDYFHVYNSCNPKTGGLFFLLIKVYLDKYYNEEINIMKKEQYKNNILYILNKYANHNDLDNIYIYNMIPKYWNISDISNFIYFNLKKKMNTHMNLQIYHNLIKSNYLNISYDIIKKNEQKIIIKDKLICKVCNNPILEKSFAFFAENITVHIHCIEKYDE
ncbi:vacuolar protein sorting-associated protein 3, putative [Plasmodium sp. gorilla clade G2]|uniref:vacuolar protein sorting-associated protein 3, putative n=1 Tax=Plasmodium sp. gorilla clade G2 TaxID=880535 RepID=UPI000D22785F|nr:vacuolar protein sorting-associated protein 3, putative [Plasmodium sp. gorilla clade G2]SOV18986.1 vacuolar protein sorting-associated protein 3, putative [Plasmodium sp. gorilla clade G2]